MSGSISLWRPFKECISEHSSNISLPSQLPLIDKKANSKDTTNSKIVNLTGKHLPWEAAQILLNIYESLKTEEENTGKIELLKKISEWAKVGFSTIFNITKNGVSREPRKRKKKVLKNVPYGVKVEIRNIVYGFYKRNISPTVAQIMTEVRRRQFYFPYKSATTLKVLLNEMNLKYKKLDRRQKLMESSRIAKERRIYLDKIRQFREENRNIVYLDETWYDTHETKQKGWTDGTTKTTLDAPPSRGKRIIIVHAGNENGFVKNCLKLSAKNLAKCSADYHKDMDSNLFENWFEHDLIPNLDPNSVIVLDNAPYHSRQLEKIPTSATKKSDIVTFFKITLAQYLLRAKQKTIF